MCRTGCGCGCGRRTSPRAVISIEGGRLQSAVPISAEGPATEISIEGLYAALGNEGPTIIPILIELVVVVVVVVVGGSICGPRK